MIVETARRDDLHVFQRDAIETFVAGKIEVTLIRADIFERMDLDSFGECICRQR